MHGYKWPIISPRTVGLLDLSQMHLQLQLHLHRTHHQFNYAELDAPNALASR